MIKNNTRAIIIFTREPEPGKTKTRMMPYLDPKECCSLHMAMLRDIRSEMKRLRDTDMIVAYAGGEPEFLRRLLGKNAVMISQRGDNIGERMENAVSDVLSLGYEKTVLIGADIPELRHETIEEAFDSLDTSDIVIGPTEDGGYYLIGMKETHHEAFDVKLYGVSTVLDETVASMHDAGLSVSIVRTYHDIDTREDAAAFRYRARRDGRLRRSHTGRFLADKARLSVIVPVYNEEKTVRELIRQLRPIRDEAEIIIVDGGSTDATLDIIGSEFTVISCRKGRGSQLNAGARAATGDILFFLHCDSVLPRDAAGEIHRCMAYRDYGCFGVKFRSKNFFMLTNRIISNHRALVRRLPFGDQGVFMDRGLFERCGGFPEIPVMEDYELALRLRRMGARPGMTRRRILTSDRRYGKGTLDILRTEALMCRLRAMYRLGTSAEDIARIYKDKR